MAIRKPVKTTSTKGLLKEVRALESKAKLPAISMPRPSVAIKRQPGSPLTPARAAQQAELHKAMKAFFGK